jgi:hypothetical protein
VSLGEIRILEGGFISKKNTVWGAGMAAVIENIGVFFGGGGFHLFFIFFF